MRTLLLLLCAFTTACGALPQDPEGTLDRVRSSHVMRVGLVTGAAELVAPLLKQLEQDVGAKPQLSSGAAEPLLALLDAGKLDLVLGPFAKDSPWQTGVAFGPPLRAMPSGDHILELKAAMRNGENRWIMAVEHASRAVTAEARR